MRSTPCAWRRRIRSYGAPLLPHGKRRRKKQCRKTLIVLTARSDRCVRSGAISRMAVPDRQPLLPCDLTAASRRTLRGRTQRRSRDGLRQIRSRTGASIRACDPVSARSIPRTIVVARHGGTGRATKSRQGSADEGGRQGADCIAERIAPRDLIASNDGVRQQDHLDTRRRGVSGFARRRRGLPGRFTCQEAPIGCPSTASFSRLRDVGAADGVQSASAVVSRLPRPTHIAWISRNFGTRPWGAEKLPVFLSKITSPSPWSRPARSLDRCRTKGKRPTRMSRLALPGPWLRSGRRMRLRMAEVQPGIRSCPLDAASCP